MSLESLKTAVNAGRELDAIAALGVVQPGWGYAKRRRYATALIDRRREALLYAQIDAAPTDTPFRRPPRESEHGDPTATRAEHNVTVSR